jgi:hypothetical protein
MSMISKALPIAMLVVGCGGVLSADPTTWTLNATFTEGSSPTLFLIATGTFQTTGGSGSVAPVFDSWNIDVTGMPTAHEFTDSNTTSPPGAIAVEFPPNASWPSQTAEELTLANEPGFSPYIDLFLKAPLTSSGGSITLLGGYSCDGTCGTLDVDISRLTGSSTPEPVSVALLATIAVILGVVAYRRRDRMAPNSAA